MSAASPNGNGFSQRYSTIIQTVMVASAFLGAFWAGIISPISVRLSDVEKSSIALREHEEFKLRIDKDISRINAQLLTIVPSAVHDAHWAATAKDIQQLADRLNDLRTSTTSTYTIRDEVVRLQTEITELRRLLAERKP